MGISTHCMTRPWPEVCGHLTTVLYIRSIWLCWTSCFNSTTNHVFTYLLFRAPGLSHTFPQTAATQGEKFKCPCIIYYTIKHRYPLPQLRSQTQPLKNSSRQQALIHQTSLLNYAFSNTDSVVRQPDSEAWFITPKNMSPVAANFYTSPANLWHCTWRS